MIAGLAQYGTVYQELEAYHWVALISLSAGGKERFKTDIVASRAFALGRVTVPSRGFKRL